MPPRPLCPERAAQFVFIYHGMLDRSVRSFNSPAPKFFLIIAAKPVSPRWGFGFCVDPIPGALPQADMSVPHSGRNRIARDECVTICRPTDVPAQRACVPGQRPIHMPAQGNALGYNAPATVEP